MSRDCLVIVLILDVLVESLFDSASQCSQAVAKGLRVLLKNNPKASKVAAVWFRMTGQRRRVGCAILPALVRRRPKSGLTLPSGLDDPYSCDSPASVPIFGDSQPWNCARNTCRTRLRARYGHTKTEWLPAERCPERVGTSYPGLSAAVIMHRGLAIDGTDPESLVPGLFLPWTHGPVHMLIHTRPG